MLVLFEDSILTWPVIWFAVSLMTVLFTLRLQIVQLHDYIMWLVFSLMSVLFTLLYQDSPVAWLHNVICCLSNVSDVYTCIRITLLHDHIMWRVYLMSMLFTLCCLQIALLLDHIMWLAVCLILMLFTLCCSRIIVFLDYIIVTC